MEEEQVLPDRAGTDLKVDLNTPGCKTDTEKEVTLDIQMKPSDVLIPERNVQIANHKTLYSRSTKEIC